MLITLGDIFLPVLVVEDGSVYYQYCNELLGQCNGNDGNFVLSNNNKILDFKKMACIYFSPWDVDFGNRKFLTKFYEYVKNIANGEEYYAQVVSLFNCQRNFMDNLGLLLPFDVEYDEPDLGDLLKVFNFRICKSEKVLIEQLVLFLRTWCSLFGDFAFIFVGFRAFLNEEEYQEFVKLCIYEHFNVLLMEQCQRQSVEGERYYIVDKDGCFIY